MTGIPASVLALWAQLANFVNPPTRGWEGVVMSAILGVICITVVGLRLWLRVFVQRQSDVSDWCSLGALIFTLAYLITFCIGVKILGLDHHVYDLTTDQLESILKFTFAEAILTNWCGTLVRLSILLFYRRLLNRYPSAPFKWAIWGTMGVTCVSAVASTAGIFFNCKPLIAFWMAYDPAWIQTHEYHCLDEGRYIIVASGIYMVLDVIIAVMPTPLIWKLHLPMKQRIAVWLLFVVGLFATMAAIIRIHAVLVAFYKSYDYTWNLYWVFFWSSIEFSLAIVCSSAPALKAFTKHTVEIIDSRNSSKMSSKMSSTMSSKMNTKDSNTFREDALLTSDSSHSNTSAIRAFLRPKLVVEPVGIWLQPWRRPADHSPSEDDGDNDVSAVRAAKLWLKRLRRPFHHARDQHQVKSLEERDLENATLAPSDDLDDINREIRKLRVRNQGWGPCTLSTKGFGHHDPAKPRRGRVGGGFGEGYRDLVMVPALQDGEIVVEKTVELVMCETIEESRCGSRLSGTQSRQSGTQSRQSGTHSRQSGRPGSRRAESWEQGFLAPDSSQGRSSRASGRSSRASKRPPMERIDSWYQWCAECGEAHRREDREYNANTSCTTDWPLRA